MIGEKAWMKVLKTSKSFKSYPSFLHGCGIFQEETSWNLHFPRCFNCDMLTSWGGWKQAFKTNHISLTLHPTWHKLYNLFPLGSGIDFSVGALFLQLCMEHHRSFHLDGNDQERNTTWSQWAYSASRKAVLSWIPPAIPLSCSSFLRWQSLLQPFKPSNKEEPLFWLCSSTCWQQYTHRSCSKHWVLSRDRQEVSCSFCFSCICTFFFLFFALVDETWIVPGILNFGKSYHPCSHVLPHTAACPLPQDDKHTGEVRGTITAHGYGNKEEISTLLNLKHTNMPAPWSW